MHTRRDAGMRTFEQRDHFVEYSAELLDCASYLVELSVERVEYSRELSRFTKSERIFGSRELIEYSKQLDARTRYRLGTVHFLIWRGGG